MEIPEWYQGQFVTDIHTDEEVIFEKLSLATGEPVNTKRGYLWKVLQGNSLFFLTTEKAKELAREGKNFRTYYNVHTSVVEDIIHTNEPHTYMLRTRNSIYKIFICPPNFGTTVG